MWVCVFASVFVSGGGLLVNAGVHTKAAGSGTGYRRADVWVCVSGDVWDCTSVAA